MRVNSLKHRPSQQSGVALIFGLIVLLTLTMVGISAMNTATLQGKIAANKRNMDLAFQSAESGLINAESWLMCQSGQAPVSADGNTNVWTEGTMPGVPNLPDSWWKANGTVFGTDVDFSDVQDLTGVESEPRYVIEQLSNGATQFNGCIPENLNITGQQPRTRCLYRVTSRGTGRNVHTQAVLRSHFALHYPRSQCREARL